jgi:hypothetical protein
MQKQKAPEVGVPVRRAFFPEVRSFDETKRTITFVSSDESVDRYGDILRVSGWKYQNYLRNPIVLWAHRSGEPPVGKCIDLRIETSPPALVQVVEFADAATYPFADTIRKLYQGKFLNAVSVGFLPLEQPTAISDLESNTVGYEYTSQELLELSCVPLPANQNALARAVSGGVVTEADVKKFFSEEEDSASTIPETVTALKQEIATLKMPPRQENAEVCTLQQLCDAVKQAGASVHSAEKSPASDETEITTFEQLGATGRDVTTLDELGEALGESTIISPAGSRKWRDVR